MSKLSIFLVSSALMSCSVFPEKDCIIEGNITGIEGDNSIIVPEFIDMTYPDVDGIPANILIESSTGIIIGRDLHGEELMDKLSGLFLIF